MNANRDEPLGNQPRAVRHAEQQIERLVDYQSRVQHMVESLAESTGSADRSGDAETNTDQLAAMVAPPYGASEIHEMHRQAAGEAVPVHTGPDGAPPDEITVCDPRGMGERAE